MRKLKTWSRRWKLQPHRGSKVRAYISPVKPQEQYSQRNDAGADVRRWITWSARLGRDEPKRAN